MISPYQMGIYTLKNHTRL